MKKTLYLIMLFYTTLNYSQTKNEVECVYTVYTSVDMDENAKKTNLSESILKTKPLEYKLIVKNNKTQYYENPSLFIDGVDEQSIKLRRIISAGAKLINVDLASGIINQEIENAGGFYCINTLMNSYEWKISSETKKIDNYECYKATLTIENLDKLGNISKREVIAYFAPSIPIKSGPLSYCGLPGLILEIQEKSKVIRITSLNFKELKGIEIIKSTKCDFSFNSRVEYEKFLADKRRQ